MRRMILSAFAVAVVATTLVGCGGSGGGANAPVNNQTLEAPDPKTPPPVLKPPGSK